jgi:hypothetical protein
MLWSQFSAIFTMTLFSLWIKMPNLCACVWPRQAANVFSHLLKKLLLVRQCPFEFRIRYVCTYRPVWPDWANFRSLGDCFVWTVSWKLQTLPAFLGQSFPQLRLHINFGKNGLHTFWANFSKSHLVTLVRKRIEINGDFCRKNTTYCCKCDCCYECMKFNVR